MQNENGLNTAQGSQKPYNDRTKPMDNWSTSELNKYFSKCEQRGKSHREPTMPCGISSIGMDGIDVECYDYEL